MAKRIVTFHPSIIIAESQGHLLMGRYDSTYPFSLYRLAFNPLGGNPTQADFQEHRGPEETLLREIAEEFDPAAPANPDYHVKQPWAPPTDIRAIQDDLLARVYPYHDFYVDVPAIEGGRPAHTAIYSVFRAFINPTTMELARENVTRNRTLTTEGFIGITSIDALVRGDDKLAHSAGAVLAEALGKPIPCLIPNTTCFSIGDIRPTYADYTKNFEYSPKAFRM